MTKRIGIFGYPLGHSLSSAFQQAALDALEIDATYAAWPTPPDELAAAVEGLRDPDCLGANVTLPHKEAAAALMDELDPAAEEIGAVNTIVHTDGQLKGYNTDTTGFLRALRESAGFEPEGRAALVLGAGGVARAIAYALREAGIARLTIANRTEARAHALATEMRRGRFRPDAVSLDMDRLVNSAPFADLLVNATSMGMAGGTAPALSPVPPELISGSALCYDAVYAPPLTAFLRAADEAGARGAGGLSMLIYQGAEAFELWTGQKAPVDVMFEAAETALQPG